MLLLRRCLHSYYCTFSMGFSLFTIYAYTFCFTVPCRHADRMGSLQIPAGPSRLIPTWLIYELFSLCSLQFGSFSRRSLFRKYLFLLPFWLGILNKWNIYTLFSKRHHHRYPHHEPFRCLYYYIFNFLKKLLKSLEFDIVEWAAAVSRCTQRSEVFCLMPSQWFLRTRKKVRMHTTSGKFKKLIYILTT